MHTIPFFGLQRQYATIGAQLRDATHQVYSSGQMLNGPFTDQFEDRIAVRTNRQYGIAVNSCTQAILFTLIYYTRVLTHRNILLPAVSFIATLNSPVLAGYTSYFADVNYHGLMDIDKIDLQENKIDLVMYVNLAGNMLDYNKLKIVTSFFDNDQVIIEDAAQSFGASFNGVPSGKCGNASVLSFDPTKNLPNYGSGGMILTDDEELANFCFGFRDNGRGTNYHRPGTNSRMSEADCAQMLVKLQYFDQWQSRRKEIAAYYSQHLHDIVGTPFPLPTVDHAWSKYMIRTADSEELQLYLKESGIETKINYHRPLATLPLLSGKNRTFDSATSFCNQHLSLPIYPELTDSEVETIVDLIQQFHSYD